MATPNWYNVKDDGGAVGNGTTDDTTAFQNAASSGKVIYIPHGTYKITGTVTVNTNMVGDGYDDSQSIIKIFSGGRLDTGDNCLHWHDFKVQSSDNNVTFVKVAHSNFKFDHFIMEALSSATGQVGIEFAVPSGNLYHCAIRAFRFMSVDYPVKITGTSTGQGQDTGRDFINNHLGDLSDNWNDFVTAVTIENDRVFGLNHVGGYFEFGTNAIYWNGGRTDSGDPGLTDFRSNVFEMHCDNVTAQFNSNKNIGSDWPSIWILPRQEVNFAATMGKTIGAQKILSKSALFRAYRSADQTGITDDTATKIQFASETIDTIGQFDSATNYRYQAPYCQRMRVSAQAQVTTNLTAGDRVDLYLYKNGSAISQTTGFCQGSNGITLGISDFVDLAKDDYIEVYVKANEAGGSGTHTVTGSSALTYFCGDEV